MDPKAQGAEHSSGVGSTLNKPDFRLSEDALATNAAAIVLFINIFRYLLGYPDFYQIIEADHLVIYHLTV